MIHEASIGDTVELTEQWSDFSGIGMCIHAEGEQFEVVGIDLSTDNVIVRDVEGFMFSLEETQYKIVEKETENED